MFEYFRNNYPWNLSVWLALNCGGQISEVEEACHPLLTHSALNDKSAQEAWIQSWIRVAERLEAVGSAEIAKGRNFSGSRKLRRASCYYLIGERMFHGKESRRIPYYMKGIEAFKRSAEVISERVEFVEVPYGDKTLKGIFKPAAGAGKSPCIIHFGGFDVLKEIIFMSGVADELAVRGIASLVVDHPGLGYALRIDDLPSIIEMERPAGACVDYLESRSDIDPSRIGIMAQSMGGYYAPRATAFEQRLSLCVVWGAFHDYGPIVEARLRGLAGGEKSISGWEDHAKWVFGKNSLEDVLAHAQQMAVEPFMDKITCPLLVTHGENDRQIPLYHAERTYAAAKNSIHKELKIFKIADGGAEHCQCDNWSLAVDYMSDWVAEAYGCKT